MIDVIKLLSYKLSILLNFLKYFLKFYYGTHLFVIFAAHDEWPFNNDDARWSTKKTIYFLPHLTQNKVFWATYRHITPHLAIY